MTELPIICPSCQADNVPLRTRCRSCERPLPGWIGRNPSDGRHRECECLRCKAPLALVGERSWHELQLEAYFCPRCGHVEFFAPGVGVQSQTVTLPIPSQAPEPSPDALPLPGLPDE
jgi:hypothetical protein